MAATRTPASPAAIGWGAALLLHGGLLLLLVPIHGAVPPPPANPPVVSLLLQKPTPVAPKPPDTPAIRPATPAHIIANTTPKPDEDGFVAAQPLPGNVNQPPEYPPQALAQREQGRLLLSIDVQPDGSTNFVAVTQSSGFALLDAAAQTAVRNWRFAPASLNGHKVDQVIPFWIVFDLDSKRAGPPAQ